MPRLLNHKTRPHRPKRTSTNSARLPSSGHFPERPSRIRKSTTLCGASSRSPNRFMKWFLCIALANWASREGFPKESFDQPLTVAINASTNAMTKWTDASGMRHGQAKLDPDDGGKLWLRKPNANPTFMVADSENPIPTPPLPCDLFNEWPTIGSMGSSATQRQIRKPAAPRLASEFSALPANLVYLRVSREFLENYVERAVHQNLPVRDCILGTKIIGEASTSGKTVVVLQPSDGQAVADVDFSGTVHARSRGLRAPVILHSIADTRFRARKRIVMGNPGLTVAPAKCSATTRSMTMRIDSYLPGLRGRLAERLAWRRVAEMRHKLTRSNPSMPQR